MSRTKKGSRPPTREYWGRRGWLEKNIVHGMERAQAKQELLTEPREPEYDEREYVPEEVEYGVTVCRHGFPTSGRCGLCVDNPTLPPTKVWRPL